ncbi:DNA alkylation repair protein [Actinocorallia longicatena]|uniref:DNA alkylation repair protein n=1 Tax=Actinocorallia longicatena TaxID=111803 RepID=A0ABP6QFS5_9ACTN
MSVEEIADRIEGELRIVASPERAVGEKAYLKSELEHLGVPVPEIRKITRVAVAGLGREEALALAAELWPPGIHELRMAAIETLVRHVGLLRFEDLAVAEGLIRDSRTWAYVDTIAVKIVGELLRDDRSPLDSWVRDENFWIRRTSLLALLPGVRDGDPDLDRLTAYGDLLIGEREFFIRKALGWVLRELAKRDPAWVRAWVRARIGEVSGVTFREAVRMLPERDQTELRAAYAAR